MKAKKHLQFYTRILGFSASLFLNGDLHGSSITYDVAKIAMSNSSCVNEDETLPQHCPKTQDCSDSPSRNYMAHLDFLYWQANEDGLEYGTKMVASPLLGAPSQAKTTLLDVNFKWDPGFRLGIGYVFNDFDRWALNANWTHIHNHAHRQSKAQGIESQVGNVDTIISPWVNLLFELRAGASGANAHWQLKYNTMDLDLGRYFSVSDSFALVPYFGFRGAFIHQHYQVDYDSVFLLAAGAPTFKREVFFRAHNQFNGFGLRGGTVFLWHLDPHWHLFSKVSASVLYGHFSVKMKNIHDQGLGEGPVLPSPLDFRASEHFWRTRFNLEETIGFGWETFLKCEQYRLCFQAAYELSQWLNQNQLFYTLYFRGQDTISSVPIRNQGNLSFQGIRLSAALDF